MLSHQTCTHIKQLLRFWLHLENGSDLSECISCVTLHLNMRGTAVTVVEWKAERALWVAASQA